MANVLLPLYADEDAGEIEAQKRRLVATWDHLSATIEERARMLQETEALSRWLVELHHSLRWIATASAFIASAKQRENDEAAVGDNG